MSDKISKLKIERTIKEYDYLKSEYDYIVSLSDEADKEFMEVINKYLENRPALKEIYESKEEKIINDNFNKVKERAKRVINNSNSNVEDIEFEKELPKRKSKKSRTLYRQIVKETHPDKVDDENLLELYRKATESYHEDDATSLYAICNELGISFGVNEDDLIFFEQNIVRIKGEIDLVKNMYSYEWSQATTDKQKDSIINRFIKNKIK